MRRIVCLVLAVMSAPAQKISFDSSRPGTIPEGWTVAMTHEGGPPQWEIVADDSAPSKPAVFAQTSQDKTSARYPLAIFDQASLADGSVSVRFKTISGAGDQAAGIVWRYRDPNNYYIVRANALEDNVVLYKVEGGKRIPLAPTGTDPKTYGVKHRVPKKTWSTLKVDFKGTHFDVFFDGTKIMEVEDATFVAAGKAGLRTKADSVTYFNDFTLTER